MVKHRGLLGQATTEFIVMVALMTLFGIRLMTIMIGPDQQSGSIKMAEDNAISSITNDEK